jgi:hypothetical protein
MGADLAARGYATLRVLDGRQCRELAALYDDDTRFRSRVVMQRHNYGRGEYKYLAYPLPEVVAKLRAALYPPLAAIANQWGERQFPLTLDEYLDECHAAGQTKPTPLLLRYGPEDFNCLHQDLYGPLVFRRRVRVGRAASTRPIAPGSCAAITRRGGDLPGASPSCAGHTRHLSCHDAPRRQPGAQWTAPNPRHHLPRCGLVAAKGPSAQPHLHITARRVLDRVQLTVAWHPCRHLLLCLGTDPTVPIWPPRPGHLGRALEPILRI